ncbi:MAG: NTP transferase domain-containing protein [bacterium]|nr:NTP transferase domain-containing protein [bacterium]
MTAIVILAGGRGKRMGGDRPKVLQRIDGHTLVEHLLEAVEESDVCVKPVIVVGFGADQIRDVVGSRAEYVTQEPQLGTGHAVGFARELLEGRADQVMVLYGDNPFVSAGTIRKLDLLHSTEGRVLTMMTVHVEDFSAWRAPFSDFGRIIRDTAGRVVRIVEKKDATPEQLEIRELNPALYCFKAAWLWEHLPRLTNDNAQGEFLLTDLVGMAITEGQDIASVEIDPFECLGINTPEHLAMAEQIAHEGAH